MRFSRNQKKVAQWDRRAEMLKGRAAAVKLDAVRPGLESVDVELRFEPVDGLAHADQLFSLFPAAKAYFVYPCPFGDCDGLYDLQSRVLTALEGKKSSASDSLKCTGARIRNGVPGSACELQMSFTIQARYR